MGIEMQTSDIQEYKTLRFSLGKRKDFQKSRKMESRYVVFFKKKKLELEI
jgi:hypothetical protein